MSTDDPKEKDHKDIMLTISSVMWKGFCHYCAILILSTDTFFKDQAPMWWKSVLMYQNQVCWAVSSSLMAELLDIEPNKKKGFTHVR